MRDIQISLPHIIISHMTSSSGVDRHLPYTHLLTHLFEEAGINLTMAGALLSMKETIGSTTLHAMKYHYVCIERRWIRFVNIPAGVEYGGYKSPHDSNSDVQFDEREYFDYIMLFLQQEEGDDGQHSAQDDEEVHQEIPVSTTTF
ncbi:hypothetical protein Scep_012491 [Stephania cephalantha]|uniref:Uncharacterized protein n=1 Tax=Stephania cephalantha TaxID=152367 RepID=A0AAP0JGZ0_9MAGN